MLTKVAGTLRVPSALTLFFLASALSITLFGFSASIAFADDPFKPDVLPPVPTVSESAFLADPPASKLSAFRKVLISEAEKSCKAGEISRMELFKLRIATLNPKVLKSVHQACCEHAVSEGKATSAAAIDWMKIVDVIKELLPIILQIISLFS